MEHASKDLKMLSSNEKTYWRRFPPGKPHNLQEIILSFHGSMFMELFRYFYQLCVGIAVNPASMIPIESDKVTMLMEYSRLVAGISVLIL